MTDPVHHLGESSRQRRLNQQHEPEGSRRGHDGRGELQEELWSLSSSSGGDFPRTDRSTSERDSHFC